MTHIPQATVDRAAQAAWEAYDQARRFGDPRLEQFAAAYCIIGGIAGNRTAPVIAPVIGANVEALT